MSSYLPVGTLAARGLGDLVAVTRRSAAGIGIRMATGNWERSTGNWQPATEACSTAERLLRSTKQSQRGTSIYLGSDGLSPLMGGIARANEGLRPRIGLDFHRRMGVTHRKILYRISLCAVGCTHPTSEWDDAERSQIARARHCSDGMAPVRGRGVGPARRATCVF